MRCRVGRTKQPKKQGFANETGGGNSRERKAKVKKIRGRKTPNETGGFRVTETRLRKPAKGRKGGGKERELPCPKSSGRKKKITGAKVSTGNGTKNKKKGGPQET